MTKKTAKAAQKKTAPNSGASKNKKQKASPATVTGGATKPVQKSSSVDASPSANIERQDILKRQLIKTREEIVAEAKTEIGKYIKGETRQLVESVLDDGDWSVIDLAEDINLKRLAAHREVLLKIDEALRKLHEGTYGVCEDCGETINTARLKVLPFAIFCKDCQEKREDFEKVDQEEL